MPAFKCNTVKEVEYRVDVRKGFRLLTDMRSVAYDLFGVNGRTVTALLIKRAEGVAYNCWTGKSRKKGSKKGPLKERPIQEPIEPLKMLHRVWNTELMRSEIDWPKSIAAYQCGLNVADAADQHIWPSHWFPRDVSRWTPEMLTDWQVVSADPSYKFVARNELPHDNKSPSGTFAYVPFVYAHLDVSNFFNSITSAWVRKFFFYEVKYNTEVSWILAQLATVRLGERRFLAQGSPISGVLANLVFHWRCGKKIEAYLAARSPRWAVTFYSDDISMTHPEHGTSQADVDQVLSDIKKIVEKAGFRINEKKTRVQWSRNEAVKVLGVIINEKRNVPKELYYKTKSLLVDCTLDGWEKHKHRVDGVDSSFQLVQYLRGILQFIRIIRQDRFEQLNKLFEEAQQKWPIEDTMTTVLSGGKDGH